MEREKRDGKRRGREDWQGSPSSLTTIFLTLPPGPYAPPGARAHLAPDSVRSQDFLINYTTELS